MIQRFYGIVSIVLLYDKRIRHSNCNTSQSVSHPNPPTLLAPHINPFMFPFLNMRTPISARSTSRRVVICQPSIHSLHKIWRTTRARCDCICESNRSYRARPKHLTVCVCTLVVIGPLEIIRQARAYITHTRAFTTVGRQPPRILLPLKNQ